MQNKTYFVRFWDKENGEVTNIECYYSAEEVIKEIQEWDDKGVKYDVFTSTCILDKS